MKKLLNPIFVFLVIILFPGCKKEIQIQEEQNLKPANDKVLNHIIDMGFAMEDIIEYDDYYLVEGDIAFPKNETIPDSVSNNECIFKQSFTTELVTKRTRINVYLNETGFGDYTNNLSTALDWALNVYNNLGLKLTFVHSSTIILSDIEICCDNNIGSYAISGFPRWGIPYYRILISKFRFDQYLSNCYGQCTIDVSKLTLLLVHEIGHSIGLRHTDWKLIGEESSHPDARGAWTVPGTSYYDAKSVMNSFPWGRSWEGFTPNDIKALHFLYPK